MADESDKSSPPVHYGGMPCRWRHAQLTQCAAAENGNVSERGSNKSATAAVQLDMATVEHGL